MVTNQHSGDHVRYSGSDVKLGDPFGGSDVVRLLSLRRPSFETKHGAQSSPRPSPDAPGHSLVEDPAFCAVQQ
eukprot:5427964-Lingulodinium_polyedra.AAC.1